MISLELTTRYQQALATAPASGANSGEHAPGDEAARVASPEHPERESP
jgi:hypothetical protein